MIWHDLLHLGAHVSGRLGRYSESFSRHMPVFAQPSPSCRGPKEVTALCAGKIGQHSCENGIWIVKISPRYQWAAEYFSLVLGYVYVMQTCLQSKQICKRPKWTQSGQQHRSQRQHKYAQMDTNGVVLKLCWVCSRSVHWKAPVLRRAMISLVDSSCKPHGNLSGEGLKVSQRRQLCGKCFMVFDVFGGQSPAQQAGSKISTILHSH